MLHPILTDETSRSGEVLRDTGAARGWPIALEMFPLVPVSSLICRICKECMFGSASTLSGVSAVAILGGLNLRDRGPIPFVEPTGA